MAKKGMMRDGACCGCCGGNSGPRMMWAWLLLVFGLIGLANNYGYPLLDFMKWWPAIFVVWGLKKLYFAYSK